MSYSPLVLDPSMPSGVIAETFPRRTATLGTNSGVVSGTLILTAILLPRGRDITNITFATSAAGATSPTNQWFCLTDSALNVLGKTADDTTNAWALRTAKTLAITGGPYRTTRAGLFYVGVVVVASAVPNFQGVTDTSGSDAVTGLAPTLTGPSTTGLTNPASLGSTAASITAGLRKNYAYVS